MKLYRYEPNKGSRLLTVRAGQIWMADHRKFNDPFDVGLRVDGFKEPDWSKSNNLFRAAKTLYSDVDESRLHWIFDDKVIRDIRRWCEADSPSPHNSQQFVNQAIARINRFGMSCFCSYLDNPLMWAHYASGHQGFCIEYEVKPRELENGLAFLDVNYTSKSVKLNAADLLFNPSSFAHHYLASKSPEWAYEGEWRLIDYRGEERSAQPPYELPLPSCVEPVAFYLGMRSSEQFSKEVQTAFSEYSKDIIGFKMEPNHYARKLEYVEL